MTIQSATVMKAAWKAYKYMSNGEALNRKRFAYCLRTAWAEAKIKHQAAMQRASAVSTPASDALFALEMKDGWTSADFARATELRAA